MHKGFAGPTPVVRAAGLTLQLLLAMMAANIPFDWRTEPSQHCWLCCALDGPLACVRTHWVYPVAVGKRQLRIIADCCLDAVMLRSNGKFCLALCLATHRQCHTCSCMSAPSVLCEGKPARVHDCMQWRRQRSTVIGTRQKLAVGGRCTCLRALLLTSTSRGQGPQGAARARGGNAILPITYRRPVTDWGL